MGSLPLERSECMWGRRGLTHQEAHTAGFQPRCDKTSVHQKISGIWVGWSISNTGGRGREEHRVDQKALGFPQILLECLTMMPHT